MISMLNSEYKLVKITEKAGFYAGSYNQPQPPPPLRPYRILESLPCWSPYEDQAYSPPQPRPKAFAFEVPGPIVFNLPPIRHRARARLEA